MRAILGSTLALFLGSVCVAGCSGGVDDRPAVYPVTGTVTLNGKPVAGVAVTFSSENAPRSASGKTDDNGKYWLTTYNFKDGAVAGEHQVVITKFATQNATSDPAKATGQDLSKGPMAGYPTPDKSGNMKLPEGSANEFPAKFADSKASGLKATVSASGKNEINFPLDE